MFVRFLALCFGAGWCLCCGPTGADAWLWSKSHPYPPNVSLTRPQNVVSCQNPERRARCYRQTWISDSNLENTPREVSTRLPSSLAEVCAVLFFFFPFPDWTTDEMFCFVIPVFVPFFCLGMSLKDFFFCLFVFCFLDKLPSHQLIPVQPFLPFCAGDPLCWSFGLFVRLLYQLRRLETKYPLFENLLCWCRSEAPHRYLCSLSSSASQRTLWSDWMNPYHSRLAAD